MFYTISGGSSGTRCLPSTRDMDRKKAQGRCGHCGSGPSGSCSQSRGKILSAEQPWEDQSQVGSQDTIPYTLHEEPLSRVPLSLTPPETPEKSRR